LSAVTRLDDEKVAGDQGGRRRQRYAFQLHALADNLANVRRALALPEKVELGSLTLLRATVVKIGAK